MNAEELVFRSVDDGLIKFNAVSVFEIDGIEYDPWTIPNVPRLIVALTYERSCDCDDGPSDCNFEGIADYTTGRGECLSEAYRWRPGMVYYRSTKFDTPIYPN